MKGFEFFCKIHKKPRGNWRPKCEIRVTINPSDFPHRPEILPLRILGRYDEFEFLPEAERIPLGRYFASKTIEQYSSYDRLKPYAVVAERWTGRWGIWINSGIYNNPRRGENHYRYSEKNKEFNGKIYYYSYVYFINGGYIEPDQQELITCQTEFYLDWRPGARPDYSDIAEQLTMIPTILSIMLMDGLDNGESEEIIITQNTIKQQKIKEKKKEIEIRRKIRVEQ